MNMRSARDESTTTGVVLVLNTTTLDLALALALALVWVAWRRWGVLLDSLV